MKEERNVITMDEHGNVSLPTDIGATAMTALKEHDIKRTIRLSDKCSAEVYDLKTITALAFRIHSFGAAEVCKALLERIVYGRKEKTRVFVSILTDCKTDSRWQA